MQFVNEPRAQRRPLRGVLVLGLGILTVVVALGSTVALFPSETVTVIPAGACISHIDPFARENRSRPAPRSLTFEGGVCSRNVDDNGFAVAIAARLFSSPDGELLLVTKEHARAAVKFLDIIYGSPNFGYAEHSREELANRRAAENNKRKVRRWLVQHEQVLKALVAVMRDSQFRTRDLEEFGALGRDDSQDAIGELMRLRMVRRKTRGYISLEPELLEVLKKLRREVE